MGGGCNWSSEGRQLANLESKLSNHQLHRGASNPWMSTGPCFSSSEKAPSTTSTHSGPSLTRCLLSVSLVVRTVHCPASRQLRFRWAWMAACSRHEAPSVGTWSHKYASFVVSQRGQPEQISEEQIIGDWWHQDLGAVGQWPITYWGGEESLEQNQTKL